MELLSATNKVLIVSNRGDFTSDHVVRYFQEKHIPYVRLNTEDFPVKIEGKISVDDFALKSNLWQFSSNEIFSVWYRRPKLPNLSEIELSKEDLIFSQRESWEFIQSIFCYLSDKRWVSKPDVLNLAEKKPIQLREAVHSGFIIPETLITNSPKDAHEFCRIHVNVIGKPLTHGGYGQDDGKVIFTSDISSSDEVDFQSVRHSPFILQKKIKKGLDIRTTVFGQEMYSFAIHSPINTVDWRAVSQDVEYEEIQTPENIKEKILRFMKVLNLPFGAFDFILTPTGEWVFIEVNPNGQWAWFDMMERSSRFVESMTRLLVFNYNVSN